MTMKEFIDAVEEAGACSPALKWLCKQKKNRKSAQWAWTHCTNASWLDWNLNSVRKWEELREYRRKLSIVEAVHSDETRDIVAEKNALYDVQTEIRDLALRVLKACEISDVVNLSLEDFDTLSRWGRPSDQ